MVIENNICDLQKLLFEKLLFAKQKQHANISEKKSLRDSFAFHLFLLGAGSWALDSIELLTVLPGVHELVTFAGQDAVFVRIVRALRVNELSHHTEIRMCSLREQLITHNCERD